MRISLVLATHGRSQELIPCLDSLCAQTQAACEILVMDQNADERLAPLLQEYRRRGLALNHQRLPRPSLSAARNRGIELARGELIGFPDDDCWYEPDTLAQLVSAAHAEPAASGYVGVWLEQAAALPAAARQDTGWLDAAAWRRFQGGAASSITLFMRRAALLELQGFDARLGVGQWYGAGEETDLVLRALACGMRLQRVPALRVHHAYGTAKVSGARLRTRARGTGALYAKHEMSAWVIVRGLLAPLFGRGRLQLGLRAGFNISWGRFEGWQRWRREESIANAAPLSSR